MLTYRDVTGISISLWADLNVAQMKNGGDNFKNVVLTVVLYAWNYKDIKFVFKDWTLVLFSKSEQETKNNKNEGKEKDFAFMCRDC